MHAQANITIRDEPRQVPFPKAKLRCDIRAANKWRPLIRRDGHHDSGVMASGGCVLGINAYLHLNNGSSVSADSKRDFRTFVFGTDVRAIAC
jgi:hypothetical protein